MAKQAFDVAAIAQEYGRKPVQCMACKMKPDLLAVVRQLHRVHGLSFPAISKAMADKFGEAISAEGYRKHFSNHERTAA